MPIQVLNDPSRNANSQALASGINSAIQGLVQHKVGQIQQQKDAADIRSAFPELPHGAVNFLASQPAKERMEFLQQYSSGLQQLQQNQQQEQMGQQQGLQALQQQQQEMQQRPQIPYAPGHQGARQMEYGGKEQKEISHKIGEAEKQLAQTKKQKPVSFAQALGYKGAAESKLGLAQQKQAFSSTEKFLKTARPEKLTAEELKAPTQRLLKWLRNGKKKDTGFIKKYVADGSFAPNLTTEEQNAARDMKKLVIGSAKMGRGLPTTARLRLEEGAKINFGNTPQAMEQGLNDLMHAIDQASYPYDHATELIKANNGKPIEGLESLVNQDYNQKFGEGLESSAEFNQPKVAQTFEKLPKANDYPNKRIQFPDGTIRRSNGTEWIKESAGV